MKVQKSIDITVSPDKIWPFFVEPEKVMQWCITFRKYEYTNKQYYGVGTPIYIEEQKQPVKCYLQNGKEKLKKI